MAWKGSDEGKWSFENVLIDPFNMIASAMGELAPSITATVIGGVVGGPAGAIAMGGLLEGSGAYNEAMKYMTEDEKGPKLDLEVANELASVATALYMPIAGVIERFQANRILKGAGLGKEGLNNSFTRTIIDKLLKKAGKEGVPLFSGL